MLSTASSPCCLVVEDEALIAMTLESTLEESGFRVAGPFTRNSAALAWLEAHTPDLALLDVLLKDGPCTSVVRVLQRRNVPFAIYSGLRPGSRPPELATVRWLEKPVSRDDLASALMEIAPKARAEAAPSVSRQPPKPQLVPHL